MYKNGLSYTIITLLSLLTHISMLTIVFIKGQYDSIMSPIILSAIILGSDILYFFIFKIFKTKIHILLIFFLLRY